MSTTLTKDEVQPAVTDIREVVAGVRAGFDERLTRPLSWRRAQLDALERMLRDGTDELTGALWSDLGKPVTEAWTTEIGFVLSDIDHARSHLAGWTRPKKARVPLALRPGKAQDD